MKIFNKTILLAVAIVFGVGSSRIALAQSPWDCIVAFDDPWALSNLGAGARDGFAVPMKYENGKLVKCGANDTWEKCWGYRERCGYSQFYVNFYPWGQYNHHHYAYNDKRIGDGACFCNPGDGLGLGQGFRDPVTNVCNKTTCPNWIYEPREMFSTGHDGRSSFWTYVYLDKGDSKRHVFWMYDIIIGGDEAVQLWYVKTDGSTWGWNYLAPGYRYLDIRDATSVWIGPIDDGVYRGPSWVVDFMIWPQY